MTFVTPAEPMPARCECGARVVLLFNPMRWANLETGERCEHK